jgi:hypothetical protein
MTPLDNTQIQITGGQAAPLSRTLAPLEAISLDEMNAVRLLNRIDTKFLLREEEALVALAQLAGRYRVLELSGRRLTHYETLYFDTGDWQLFRQHHAGAGTRYKVRSRAYVESNLAFLEVKRKHRVTRRTVKNRLRTPEMVTELDGEPAEFLHTCYPLDPHRLEIRLWNTFTRVTLVSTVRCERLTLDFDVRFQNDQSAASLRGLTIVEVKQEQLTRESDWMGVMRAAGIRPTGVSKYCVGVTLLYPQVKTNHFKPKLLLMERLLQGGTKVADDRRH